MTIELKSIYYKGFYIILNIKHEVIEEIKVVNSIDDLESIGFKSRTEAEKWIDTYIEEHP